MNHEQARERQALPRHLAAPKGTKVNYLQFITTQYNIHRHTRNTTVPLLTYSLRPIYIKILTLLPTFNCTWMKALDLQTFRIVNS